MSSAAVTQRGGESQAQPAPAKRGAPYSTASQWITSFAALRLASARSIRPLRVVQKVSSSVLQLQGAYPEELTVTGAEVAMTSTGGAGALFCDTLLLGRQPA